MRIHSGCSRRSAIVVIAATMLVAAGSHPVAAQAAASEPAVSRQSAGVLPDGTAYLIRVPSNWNGTVINDLDSATKASSADPASEFLLEEGYALSGTRRHDLRRFQYDPHAEIQNQVRVLDKFEEEFGKPDRVLQFGCSGGGAVALGIGETYPDRVDGVIPTGAQTGIVIGNMWLDLLFVLKALLAPDSDLPVVDIALHEYPTALAAWQTTLDAAQETAEGRARIALGVALAQWPTWGSLFPPTPEKPNPDDLGDVQAAMYRSAVDGVHAAVQNRHLLENGAGGVPSWNMEIDYERFYDNADPAQKRIVRQLYDKAGMNPGRELNADLDQVNEQPRIAGDPNAVQYWRAHPRTHAGTPGVPVLHVHTIGDAGLSPALMEGYAAGVRANGDTNLYRQAFVDAAGHCTFNISETAAMVETMMRRIDTGRWSDSSNPSKLNALGRSFNEDEPRFIRHRLTELNRAFYPDSPYPGGE